MDVKRIHRAEREWEEGWRSLLSRGKYFRGEKHTGEFQRGQVDRPRPRINHVEKAGKRKRFSSSVAAGAPQSGSSRYPRERVNNFSRVFRGPLINRMPGRLDYCLLQEKTDKARGYATRVRARRIGQRGKKRETTRRNRRGKPWGFRGVKQSVFQ